LSPLWTHHETFPILYKIIAELSENKKGEWVTHDEIVDAILENVETLDIATKASKQRGTKKRNEAAWMVAWFSQKITKYQKSTLPSSYSQYQLIKHASTVFERRKRKGERYAYRLRRKRRHGESR